LKKIYKISAAAVLFLLVTDMLLHKGIVRVLLPKSFPAGEIYHQKPSSNIQFINTGKQWIKAVNTKNIVNAIPFNTPGFETDIYYDTAKHCFDVHHDGDKSIGLNFDDLLQQYADRKLTASVWMDFKNLSVQTQLPALHELIRLREQYGLQHKIIVESPYTGLLKLFADSGFFTSYYVPFFNPYLMSNDSLLSCVQLIRQNLENSSIQSLSGYYFQANFLHRYFPKYPILLWGSNDGWSLVNNIYKQRVKSRQDIFIALYPFQ
jgi:hypothetical protein